MRRFLLTFILHESVPDLQDPVLAAWLVEGGESVIWGVAVHPCGQEVGVMVADPGYLHQIHIRIVSEKYLSIYAPFLFVSPN